MTPSSSSNSTAGYRILTLNRPDKLNAFNEAMLLALRAGDRRRRSRRNDAARSCSPAPAAPSAPARTSPSGWPSRARRSCSAPRWSNITIRWCAACASLPFPVIAAVNGIAAGAGCNIALACDIVVAAHSAKFVQSFARIGLVPDSGGTWLLPRLVGDARARGLALLAQDLPAETAASWGLIWKCVPDNALIYEARRICEHFSIAPTQGLALIKRALNASAGNTLDAQLDLERDLQRQASSMPDYQEGVRAFMEKRKPNFTGRKGNN